MTYPYEVRETFLQFVCGGASLRAATAAVGVSYVWDSSYSGLRLPDRPTVVFRVTAPGDPRYWRATTLDAWRAKARQQLCG